MTTMIQDLQAYVAENGNSKELWQADASHVIFGQNTNGDRQVKFQAALKAGYISSYGAWVMINGKPEYRSDKGITHGHVRVSLPESLI